MCLEEEEGKITPELLHHLVAPRPERVLGVRKSDTVAALLSQIYFNVLLAWNAGLCKY